MGQNSKTFIATTKYDIYTLAEKTSSDFLIGSLYVAFARPLQLQKAKADLEAKRKAERGVGGKTAKGKGKGKGTAKGKGKKK
eukprot:scaffold45285_cov28-Prasinocladus_malaysianus.AAC.1